MKKGISAKLQKTKKIFVIVLLMFIFFSSVLAYQIIYDKGIGKLINKTNKLSKDKLAIKMNAKVEFDKYDSDGRLLIENKKTNVHNVIVEI